MLFSVLDAEGEAGCGDAAPKRPNMLIASEELSLWREGIMLMPNMEKAKFVKGKRFDKRGNYSTKRDGHYHWITLLKKKEKKESWTHAK